MEKTRRVVCEWEWGGDMKQEFFFVHVKLEIPIDVWADSCIWKYGGAQENEPQPKECSYFAGYVSFKILL